MRAWAPALIAALLSYASPAAAQQLPHELPDDGAQPEVPLPRKPALDVHGGLSFFYTDGSLPDPYGIGHILYFSASVLFDWGDSMFWLDTTLPLFFFDVIGSVDILSSDRDGLELMTALSGRKGTRWVPLLTLEGATQLKVWDQWRLYFTALLDASLLEVSCPYGTRMTSSDRYVECPYIYSASLNGGVQGVWRGERRWALSLLGGFGFNEMAGLNPRVMVNTSLRQPVSKHANLLLYAQYAGQLQLEQTPALFDAPGFPDGGARLWSIWRAGLGFEVEL